MIEPTCPVCQDIFTDSEPYWGQGPTQVHLACADAIAEVVLSARLGNSYAASVAATIINMAREQVLDIGRIG